MSEYKIKKLKLLTKFKYFFLIVLFHMVIYESISSGEQNNIEKKEQKTSPTAKIKETILAKGLHSNFFLDSMCQCVNANKNEMLGDIKILEINRSGRCPCKISYLQNSKGEVFCIDYFIEYQEQISTYNEFIKNSNIKIINEQVAKQYFDTLLSLCKVYDLIRIENKHKIGNAIKLTGVISRRYARNPIELENDNTLHSFTLVIDSVGILKNVEMSPMEK